MSRGALEGLAEELCRTTVGWKLGDDEEALLALEEGALRIDVPSGECWCDDEPLPPLFVAGELRASLERYLEAHPDSRISQATVEALFASRTVWRRGSEARALEISCRARLETNEGPVVAEARRRAHPA